MTVTRRVSTCEHLLESSYNHNYFRTLFRIDEYDTILEMRNNDHTTFYYLANGVFSQREAIQYGHEIEFADTDPTTLEQGAVYPTQALTQKLVFVDFPSEQLRTTN